MRRKLAGLTGLVAMLGLVGCSSSEAEQIAADACGLMESLVEDGAAAMADEDLMGDLEDLQTRADDAELSDEEMQEAMREECPDVFDGLEGMFQAPGE